MATDALRKVGRSGMMASPPAKIALRVVLMSDKGVSAAGTEQRVADIVRLLCKLEARQYLRVMDTAAFDDHPMRIICMGWMSTGAKRRREIRDTLMAQRDTVLCLTVLKIPGSLGFEFSVVPSGDPVQFSEELLDLAGLALLPHEGGTQ